MGWLWMPQESEYSSGWIYCTEKILGLEPPILLPNKFNAAVINAATHTGSNNDATSAAHQAIKNSSRGAIEATKLAGDIFNNKNDKSGHHDQFCLWWKKKVGTDFTFPDTSNPQFQSHCLASAALIMNCDCYIEYLEYAKLRKDQMRFMLAINKQAIYKQHVNNYVTYLILAPFHHG